jgi:hypothetical protein
MTTRAITFSDDIRPLFRESDRDAMEAWFDLWAWEDVRDNGPEILGRVEEGSMPCDDPWPEDRVALFRSWIAAGCQA